MLLVLAGSASNLLVLVISHLVLLLVTIYVNYRRFGFYWSYLLLPVFFLIGIGVVYAIIPSSAIRTAFIIGSVISFYLLETQLGHESHLLQNLYLLSVFMIYVGLFAGRFYFVDVSFWWILVLLAIFTYLFTVQGFAGVSLPSKDYFSILTTLAITEAGLGLMLWPTHFFVNGMVLFSIFYLLWLFAFSAFFGKLSSKKIYWQMTLIGIALIVVLSTASWQPLAR